MSEEEPEWSVRWFGNEPKWKYRYFHTARGALKFLFKIRKKYDTIHADLRHRLGHEPSMGNAKFRLIDGIDTLLELTRARGELFGRTREEWKELIDECRKEVRSSEGS